MEPNHSNQLDAAVKYTGTAITNFFDSIDKVDRYLYGSKMQYFSWGIVSVLILAPILDWFLEVPHDRLTYLSTLLFLAFVITVSLAWISAWRDDEGNWTWKRAKSRLATYYATIKDTAIETRTNSSDELLYRIGKFAMMIALVWKAFQNLSVFLRKPLEHFTGHDRHGMRHFERTANTYYWVILLIGIGIIIYLYKKNPQILNRIKNELRQLFGNQSGIGEKYHNEVARIDNSSHIDLVLNTQQKDHVQLIVTQNKSLLFNDFIVAMERWKPVNCHYEYEFQDKLFAHLRKSMPEAVIEMEKPIGEKSLGNRGRADIVINDTILIEMKRDTSASAIQRAKGQIMQYSHIWKDKGPVILLLCNYEYSHAKLSYTPTMQDLMKLERSALTLVAN